MALSGTHGAFAPHTRPGWSAWVYFDTLGRTWRYSVSHRDGTDVGTAPSEEEGWAKVRQALRDHGHDADGEGR